MGKRNDTPKVYLATFPNGKQYVGITCAKLQLRIVEHYSRSKIGPKYAIHNALAKYGKDVKWEVLHVCSTFEEAKDLEIKTIQDLNTQAPNGYNLTKGGDGAKGYKISEEQRKKLSEAHMGYKMPESQKKAISAANKGKIRSLESIEKIRKAQKGRILHPAHLKNLRAANCVSLAVYAKDTNEFVGNWSSITQCAKDLGLSRTALSNCAVGLSKSTGKYTVKKEVAIG